MGKSKFGWMKKLRKSDPDVEVDTPMWLGNHSNGEFFMPQREQDRKMRDEILRRAEDQSRYLGMERREFLASSMGMATTLAVINQFSAGCGSDSSTSKTIMDMGGGGSGGGSGGMSTGGRMSMTPDRGVDGGTTPTSSRNSDDPYLIPPEAMCEDLGIFEGDEFIFDIQTHSFDDGSWRDTNPGTKAAIETPAPFACDEVDQLDCYDKDHYGELMFTDSDTTMAVITSWPAMTCAQDITSGCGLPLSNAGMRDLRDWINQRAMSQRVVNQIQVMPNDRIELQKDIMTEAMEDSSWRAASWKAYPAWRSPNYRPNGASTGQAYWLTDPIGTQFIEHGLELGLHNFAIHKGLPILSFDREHNQPHDIGPVAKAYPEANFVIYHSAISSGTDQYLTPDRVPYDPDEANPTGVNQLIRTVLDHGVANANVYGELGTTWAIVSRDSAAAQHTIGKLLKYLGPDNVVWGTDSILNGSPQSQIESFRAFTISERYQDLYGYPELTDEIKAKIFGLNTARIYRIDPTTARCQADASIFADAKRAMDAKFGKRRWTAKKPMAPRTAREFLAYAKRELAKGSPG